MSIQIEVCMLMFHVLGKVMTFVHCYCGCCIQPVNSDLTETRYKYHSLRLLEAISSAEGQA